MDTMADKDIEMDDNITGKKQLHACKCYLVAVLLTHSWLVLL